MDEERNPGQEMDHREASDASENVTYHYKYVRSSEKEKTASEETPQYAHYEFHEQKSEEESAPVQAEQKQDRKPGRSGSGDFAAKARGTVALALIFGLVSGTVFQATRLVSNKLWKTDTSSDSSKSVSTTETVSTSASITDTTDTTEESLSDIASEKGVVAAVAKAAMPSVVAITSVSIQEINSIFGYGMEYPTTGSGSGIIVGENDDELLIATNYHVVEDATTLSVCFIGDDVVSAEQETQSQAMQGSDSGLNIDGAVTAKIKGSDETNDLAVIAVQKDDIPEETMSEIQIAQIGSSDDLVVGEQVVAIGNALGYGQTVTSGWVSALNRTITLESGSTASNLIQTDAAINPGNSGGALLNMKGELIGINCAKYASNDVEGTGYAIPISEAQPILEELMNRKTRDKVEDSSQAGYLGVEAVDLTTTAIQMYGMPSGAFVMEVEQGSPAEQAGIQKNDIIVKFDGQSVSGRSDLNEKLQYYTAGETVEIVVSRPSEGEYKEQTLSVTLGSRP